MQQVHGHGRCHDKPRIKAREVMHSTVRGTQGRRAVGPGRAFYCAKLEMANGLGLPQFGSTARACVCFVGFTLSFSPDWYKSRASVPWYRVRGRLA